jgi:hypothetical protein
VTFKAGVKNLTIEQYSQFDWTVTFKINGVIQNLTGYTAAAQIRDENGELLVAFTVTLGGALGTVRFQLTSAQTTNLLKRGNWDCLLKGPSTDPFRFLQGDAEISKGVTPSVS